MLGLIAILVFVVVAMGVFAVASLLDQRSAQARLLHEMLSKIPAIDNLLRRSSRISNLQPFLEQANLKIRAGNILMLCAISAVGLAGVGFLAAGSLPPKQALLFAAVGLVLGGFLPYSYASYRRTKRFQKFEELFPEAIDTLARAVCFSDASTTALELIANELSEPVASEFRKLFEEQKFGLP